MCLVLLLKRWRWARLELGRKHSSVVGTKTADQPNKNLVKETLGALRIVEGLGNCFEVASTVSELFFGTIFIKHILTPGLRISLQ